MEIEDVDRDGLVRLFLEEAGEGLASMEQALVALEQSPDDADAVQSLFRAAHTLKGNALSLGYTDLAALTHGLEDVLDRLRSGAIDAERAVVDLLLESVDALRTMLAEVR
jgi:two-component system chemotaxis sensor kinase CheA